MALPPVGTQRIVDQVTENVLEQLNPVVATPTFIGPDAPVTSAPVYFWYQTDANGRARLFVEDGE